MIPSTLFALVTALSSIVAINGAVVQRDGSTTFQTPHPTTSVTTITVPSATTSPTTKLTTSSTTSSTTSQPGGTASLTTATPASRASTCDGVQQWQSAYGYSAGDKVIFNNQLYIAKQWTWNNAPPTHSDQWSGQGACTPPIVNSANCAGVFGWNKDTAYTTGNQVTFNGHLWIAVQWTQSNPPGDASGIWKDLGACA